jgi:deoxyribose-phosphate aldolase
MTHGYKRDTIPMEEITMRHSGPYDKNLASLIDHTIMQPDVTIEIVRKECRLAVEYGFAGVCVNLVHIALAAQLVQGSRLTVCTGVGFPLGASGYLLKAAETRDAVAGGADEIDMVINIGAVKEGDYRTLEREIQAVKDAAEGRTVKVLLEICYLSDAEIRKVCQIAAELGADFVKTSTGFGPGGATVEAVRLMRQTVGPDIGVKAAGGISSRAFALELIAAGASRLGMSKSIEVVHQLD